MSRILVPAFGLLVGSIGGSLGLPQPAHALHRRMSAFACSVDFNQNWLSDYTTNGNGVANQSSGVGAASRWILCPITSEEGWGITATAIVGVAVDGADLNDSSGSSGSVWVQACAADPGLGGAGTCGTSYALTSATGHGGFGAFINSVNLSVVNSTTYAYYYRSLWILLPPRGTYGNSFVGGLYITNN